MPVILFAKSMHHSADQGSSEKIILQKSPSCEFLEHYDAC